MKFGNESRPVRAGWACANVHWPADGSGDEFDGGYDPTAETEQPTADNRRPAAFGGAPTGRSRLSSQKPPEFSTERIADDNGDELEHGQPDFPGEFPYVGGHPEIPLHPYEPSGRGTCLACERHEIATGAALASALMAAHYGGDSGEDVDVLIAELRKRGYVIAPAPLCRKTEPHQAPEAACLACLIESEIENHRAAVGLRDVLALHYVTAIECDHDAKTDTVRCNCSVWTGTPQPSVGAAVREWVEHVAASLIERSEELGLVKP